MKIKWGRQTRSTSYGEFKDGDEIDLPKEVAKDFINQGLASSTKQTEYDDPVEEKPPIRKRKSREE